MSAAANDRHRDADDLTPLVRNELRPLAAAYMRRERPGQTLQATALVHEAFPRLAGAGTPWHDERQFVGIAARSMRQILVERARAQGAQKRWAALAVANDPESVLPSLDDALTRLGILRSHLPFTPAVNRLQLNAERLPVQNTITIVDVLVACDLAVAGLPIAAVRPLWSVLTIGLAAGIALAMILMEPATAAAAFPE